ncbi:hypothetical protein DYB32_008289 [Aphanomyces invadans]|uniref:DDE-1 domain-containing protein n=1 Tax=Aphanomyces invadans TaxID=157072 RepID=A0A3R7CVQ5_9STRA|nr:hypothetical protein DYB32_008289 [Aphanomyces invadans]
MEHPTYTYSQSAAWGAEKFNLASTPTKATIGNVLKRNATLSLRAETKSEALTARSHYLLSKKACFNGSFGAKSWAFASPVNSYASKPAASVSPVLVTEGREEMKAVTSGYSADNTYNMDETAIFYCLSPHRSITRHRQPGTKKSKKRISVALTTNAAGSDDVVPLFIGTAARPRCFNGATASELGFNYMSSKKDWMTGGIFNTYLLQMNQRTLSEDRKVLLLVDNAPPHRPDDESALTNVKVKMLPMNTTAHLQPQDAGIIASFKAKVKQRQLTNALQQIESVMAGWQEGLYEETVVNCWNRTGILDTELSNFG